MINGVVKKKILLADVFRLFANLCFFFFFFLQNIG